MKPSTLIKKIEGAGYEPVSYSGRGMYGERCVAVALEQHDDGDELSRIEGATRDSLGMGTILYWPDVPAPATLD